MKNKAGLGIVGLVGVVVIGLALAAQYGRQLAPGVTALLESATVKPGTSTATTTPPGGATVEPGTPTATPEPTPTPTEGEKAAAAVGQQYIAYRPTQAECDELVESGELESCVAPDSIQLVTRPEWEQLFPSTHFYVIGLAGRNQNELYGHSYRRRLVAWQDGQYYTAETFDQLLEANGITTITDENRELVAKAFALVTIPDYLEGKVVFTEWKEGSWPSSIRLNYNYALTAWTEIQGLKIQWRFVFYEGLLIGVQGHIPEYNVGDYTDVPFEILPRPSQDSLRYWRRR